MKTTNRKRICCGLLLCLALILAAAGMLTGCGSSEEAQKEPEEVVKEYFAYWGNRDKASMDRLLIEEQQSEEDDPDISLVTSLTLNSCMEVPREMAEEWDPGVYSDPYDFTYVDVDFDIAFEGGEGAGYADGNYQTRFYLVKEDKHDGWKIAMWGLG